MTKEEQLYKHKEPKVIRDRDYLTWLKSQPLKCFVCGTNQNIELHHIKQSSSQPKNDRQMLSLCSYHHRYSHEISPHSNAKAWRQAYSYEMQLDYAEKLYQEYKDLKCLK